MATVVRFTEKVSGKVHMQRADTDKATRRLYSYAVHVATADFRIELLVDGIVKKLHEVVYPRQQAVEI
jgi:hypothetical protein